MNDKSKKLDRIYAQCEKLVGGIYTEKRIVIRGAGDPDSPVLVTVGAPGKYELIERKPISARVLAAMGRPGEISYATCLCKFRPPRAGARPNREETELFLPFLEQEIAVVEPRVIVALGSVAAWGLIRQPVGRCHGKIIKKTIRGKEYDILPVYHPFSAPSVFREDVGGLDFII